MLLLKRDLRIFFVSRSVAQPGSAPEWGSGGPGFKSPRSDKICTTPTLLVTNLVTTCL